MTCTIEFFGVARLASGVGALTFELSDGATVADAIEALRDRQPALIGRVIASDGPRLLEGHACNLNGRLFVRSMDVALNDGDAIVLLSADAGG